MPSFVFLYNSVEIAIWAAFGIGFLVAAAKQPPPLAARCRLAAVTFFLFGGSDAVELHTGTWWKPWWLFTWKAACVVVLFGLYVENARRLRRTSK